MFTGIIQAVGRVAEVRPSGNSAQVRIDAAGLDLSDVAIGDSIACDGVCLTVVRLLPGGFAVDVSQETLKSISGFESGAAVNLEKSMRLADRLGGHLVSGHVDGRGEVTTIRAVDGSREISVRFPPELGRYIARKGSIAVNGVSLTVNSVTDDAFCVNLIPHTLAATNLGDLGQGDLVNLEIDLVARYVQSILCVNQQ
jgi:riboflavin synthase